MDTQELKTLLSLPVETCGYVDSNLRPVVDGVSNTEGNRKLCTNNRYYKIIWHTHPNDIQSYPSTEDIIKILKPRRDGNPQVSLIITKWGIWKLWAGKKNPVDNKLIKILDYSYSGLYHVTEKGRGELNHTSGHYIQSYIDELKYTLQKYNFDIRLTPWNSIRYDKYNI